MATRAIDLPPYEHVLPNHLITEKTASLQNKSNQPHGEVDMTVKEDRLEAALTVLAQAVALQTEREATRPSEVKRLWLPICAAVFISLGPQLWTANVMTRSNQDDLKALLTDARTLATEAKRDAADAAKEAKKANLNNAMLDTYNRELERALIRKGVALPSYPTLEK